MHRISELMAENKNLVLENDELKAQNEKYKALAAEFAQRFHNV